MADTNTARRGFSSPGFEQGKNSEHDAVEILTRLSQDWPPQLWLFAGAGSLHIMRTQPDGKRAMRDGAVDPDFRVAAVTIPCDGGDW